MLPRISSQQIIVFLFAVLTAVVYLTPNIYHQWSGGEGTILLRDDEHSYAARILRVTQGNLRVGNEWNYDHRNDLNLIPVLPELVLGAIAKITPLRFEFTIVFLRFLLVILLFYSFRNFVTNVLPTHLAASMVSLWILTDPGLLFYKPLISTLLPIAILPLNRFTNPLFGLSIFFLCLYYIYRTFSSAGTWKHALLASIFLSAQFYVSVYYWTHTCVWILCAFLISTSKNRWRFLGIGVGVTLILVIPYLLQSLALRSHPVFSTIAWRNGLLLKERGFYLLGHKSIYLFIALAVWKAFAKDYSSKFLAFGVLSGIGIYFSSIITGITFQNFHWHYTIAPAGFLLAFLSFPRWFRENNLAVFCLAGFSLLCGFYSGVNEYRQNVRNEKIGTLLIGKSYEESFQWIRENTDKEAVILTSATVAPHIPLRTERRSFYNTIVQMVPADEVLKYYQFYWFLHGWQGEELLQKIRPLNPVLSQYEYGFTQEQETRFREKGYPPITTEYTDQLATEISALQSTLPREYFRNFLNGKTIQYVLIGANESNWKDRLTNVFELEQVFKGSATEIYRITKVRP